MPNPQVHAAVGMLGALVIVFILYPFFKYKYKQKKIFLLIPLFLILGALISMIPDIPELARDFPSVFNPVHITRETKPMLNIPIFNICFLHPYLDSKFAESYDTTGLIMTLLAFNCVSLFYFYFAKKKEF